MTWREFLRREWLPMSLIGFWTFFWLAVFTATFL